MSEYPGTYQAVAPTGRRVRADAVSAPRATTADGLRIVEIWDWLFRGDELFGLLREAIRVRVPSVEFIPYTTVGRIHGPDEPRRLAELPELLRRLKAGAVISGVGA